MKKGVLLFILLVSVPLLAQHSPITRKIYLATRVNPNPPTIDGKGDDPVWKHAKTGSGFIQLEPVENDSPSQRTCFKIVYDNKNLYVLIRAYDSEPQKIMRRLARRDEIDDSDVVGITLDSYFDRRTAFEFSVNAAGVKRDGIFSNDSFDGHDANWDPVWEVKTSVDDSGWVAEMRIPFSQLRFSKENSGTWGMDVYRYIYRHQEIDLWQQIPKESAGFVSQFGYLKGLDDIKPPRRIELMPYALSSARTYQKEEGNPFADGRDLKFSGGLDGKIGLSDNMTVDLTVNPDFGQVEADPSEVNLTAFETFFEEKRPFFIEGKNIFQFPLALGDGDFSRESLFYSRRIGRRPHYDPDLNDQEYAEIPDQTSILSAAKLSGKTASGWSVGVLEAVTAEERAKIDSLGSRRTVVVEPLTNYFVGRLQKDMRQGNTTLGGMVTATNRNINRQYLDFINRSAYTGGLDLTHFWKNKQYMLDLKLAGSAIFGHREAILDVQTSSAHYFQRPDANYVTLDSNRTRLTGHGGSLNIGRVGGGSWRYVVGGLWRSPGLELNDLGYLRQADRIMNFVWVGYRLYNPRGIFRSASLNFNQWNGWNFGGEKLFAGGNINGGGQFTNYWRFYMGINRQMDGLSPSELRGGPALRTRGGWNNWFNVTSDSRKKWQIRLNGSNYRSDDGISYRHTARFGLEWKPTNNFNLSLNPFYSVNRENRQYVDTIEKDGQDRYIMAKLDQKTAGLVIRFNLSLTPELTIQYYGQPFISAGRYSQFKEITDPRARRYEDSFHTFSADEIRYDAGEEEYLIDEDHDGSTDFSIGLPDFNFKQFRSNLVIRWEYHPGSVLYLVWSQDRTGFDEYGDFGLSRDARDLYNVPPDNVFLMKVNHWFSL